MIMRAKAVGVAFEGHRAMHSAVASLKSAVPGSQMFKLYIRWPTGDCRQAAGDHLNRPLFHLNQYLLLPCTSGGQGSC